MAPIEILVEARERLRGLPWKATTGEDRPRRRLGAVGTSLLRTALALVTVTALVLTAPGAAYADQGYWKLVSAPSANPTASGQPGTSDDGYVFHWMRGSGSDATDLYEATGRSEYVRSSDSASAPGDVPADGAEWEMASAWSWNPAGGKVSDGDTILGGWDPELKRFEPKDGPDFIKQPAQGTIHLLANAVAGVTMAILDVAVSLLSLVDVKTLLLGGFGAEGGTWRQFYIQADAVVSKIAVPLGSAFMTLAFVLHIIKLTDSRRYGGQAWFESMMRTVVFYLAASALVAHSLELSGVIYWAARQTAAAVGDALNSTVHVDATSLTSLGQTLETTVANSLAEITYSDWTRLVPICLVVFLPIKQIVSFGITVFTTCFLRMVEIYLRAAFMPVPLSFLVNDDMRPIAVSYLKRFAGCCFMAAVFVAALGLTNTLASTVTGIFSAATADLTGLASSLATVAPIVITLSSLDAVIRKSSEIANSLFGV